MKIVQMPEHLANKIAAGEVVERPASVVKELVENSIDANSTWIKIEVEEAGMAKIKITDNGDGMSEADCKRAFLRHATSKIRTENDLFRIQTLGFRGEALASIASVSRLTIKTSEGEQAGTLLKLEGGSIIHEEKSDARKGTEIVVEDLFFNTPARLKYMKTIHTELGHITDCLNRLALSHPEIRLEAYHNGKMLFRTSGSGDMLQVIAQIYGMNVARKMIPVKEETVDFYVEGYIAKPEVTRANRQYISTIINGRFIKNHGLTNAVIRGYHTLLPIGRFPIVVLSVKMDPFLVDVNVHPAKLEVRFSKEKELNDLIERMIQQSFRKISLIPDYEQKRETRKKTYQEGWTFDETPKPPREEKDIVPPEKPILEEKKVPAQDVTEERIFAEKVRESDVPIADEEIRVQSEETVQQEKTPRVPMMYPIGQLHGTYILAQNENGLYMIDQHAAQERIKYEFFKEKLGRPVQQSQQLLIPLTFDFSKKEAIFIEEHREQLERFGLFFEPFGQQTYIIRSHPSWFPKGFEEEIIREMVEQIMEEERIDVERIREESAIMMSCKRSIKANHYLKEEEMVRLIEDLRHTKDPFTCPHGRPIIIHFSTYEIEKMFKRIM